MFDKISFDHSMTRVARAGAVVALIGALSACMPPPRDGGYNRGGYDRGAVRQADRWDWRDVQGMWCFGNNTNEFFFRDNGRTLIAQPVNRKGAAATYRFGGRGIYTETTGRRRGTYQFNSPQEAVWRSNDSRNLVITLNPC